MNDLTPKQLAELTKLFAESPVGEVYMRDMAVQYNALHQAAESELTLEQKAMKVERAAGLKYAIEWITSRVELVNQGYFKETDDKQ